MPDESNYQYHRRRHLELAEQVNQLMERKAFLQNQLNQCLAENQRLKEQLDKSNN